MRGDLTAGLADGDAPRVWGAHHYALHHGLTADEGFLSAFKSGKQLQSSKKTQEWAPVSHWFIR
jgi:hypothetical protein